MATRVGTSRYQGKTLTRTLGETKSQGAKRMKEVNSQTGMAAHEVKSDERWCGVLTDSARAFQDHRLTA